MIKNYCLLLFLSSIIGFSQTKEDVKQITSGYDVKLIESKSEFYKIKERLEKQKAVEKALLMNWPIFIKNDNGTIDELVKLTPDGFPLYLSSNNGATAIATRTNHLNTGGSLGLTLNGQGMVARVWDGGKVRASHNLLTPRITVMDDASGTVFSDHATHVTGTMVASGNASVRGMAYQATAKTYNWTDDESEALTEVLDGMLISNHSYGVPMVNSTTGVQLPEWYIGSYSQDARAWDEISYLSPYYLMVTSAGNNGNSQNSGASTFGYDKLNGDKLAKNNLTIANAQDVTVNTAGVVTSAININSSSSQGPADDGRIKPDITGNGTGVTSSAGTSNSAVQTLTGTSMSSPNVAGTLLLLQQHAKNNTNSFLRSATLKGLVTHTADEAGRPGPDAIFGWGLLNAKKAAEAISSNGMASWISEEVLNQNQTYTMTVNSDGINPLIASITWTDVPGQPNNNTTTVNNTIPALVNDLDIRITRGASTFFPWKLQSSADENAIRSADNSVDNVENIKIDTPTAGIYTITVTHKGTLSGGKQNYSLVITGVSSNFSLTPTSNDLVLCNNQNATYTFNYKQTGSLTTNFSALGVPAGAVVNISPTSLSTNGTITMTISNLGSVLPSSYQIGLRGTSGSETETRYKNLKIFASTLSPSTLIFPVNNQNDVSSSSIFKWNKDDNAETYNLQIATDANFNTLVRNVTNLVNNETQISALTQNTQYYYRVIPANRCGVGLANDATVFPFKTGVIGDCNISFAATDFSNATIANVADSEASVPITVTGGHKIGNLRVNLNINHEYVADMFVSLIGPSSIGSPEVYLLSNTCTEFNDVNASFDNSYAPVVCSNVSPSIGGQIKPFGDLSEFNNLVADGVWTLKVSDPYNGDGGNIVSASINICALTPSLLSLNDFESINLNIYPNPTTGLLNINFKDDVIEKDATISVFDIQGRFLLSKKVNSKHENLDIKDLNNGVYILNIKNGLKQTSKKIIKTNN